MTRTETPVKVLKITGLGRSGSTILDIVLGNHPQIESVGEVMNILSVTAGSAESRCLGSTQVNFAFRSAPAGNGWTFSTSTLLMRPARSGPAYGVSG